MWEELLFPAGDGELSGILMKMKSEDVRVRVIEERSDSNPGRWARELYRHEAEPATPKMFAMLGTAR